MLIRYGGQSGPRCDTKWQTHTITFTTSLSPCIKQAIPRYTQQQQATLHKGNPAQSFHPRHSRVHAGLAASPTRTLSKTRLGRKNHHTRHPPSAAQTRWKGGRGDPGRLWSLWVQTGPGPKRPIWARGRLTQAEDAPSGVRGERGPRRGWCRVPTPFQGETEPQREVSVSGIFGASRGPVQTGADPVPLGPRIAPGVLPTLSPPSIPSIPNWPNWPRPSLGPLRSMSSPGAPLGSGWEDAWGLGASAPWDSIHSGCLGV